MDALTVNLEREGFAVTVARDGVEALERFEADRPDLVLLDVMLPRLSGIDVCRAIRAELDGADHHGDGQVDRARHRRRARGRRRRLRRQAVPGPRARVAHAGRAAPDATRTSGCEPSRVGLGPPRGGPASELHRTGVGPRIDNRCRARRTLLGAAERQRGRARRAAVLVGGGATAGRDPRGRRCRLGPRTARVHRARARRSSSP